ncbi:MAG TPA: ATP-binding protein [Actinomycetota bacterium]|nr:ATP-binding protein [Actinomycetota bacterium]
MVDPASDEFRLVVPPDPRHVSTARIFAAAVARVAGADETTVEDIKVGISEACSMSLRPPAADGPVEVSIVAEPERLRFEVIGDIPPERAQGEASEAQTPTPTGIAATLGREVVSALFEDAEITGAGGRGTIRFSTPLGTA